MNPSVAAHHITGPELLNPVATSPLMHEALAAANDVAPTSATVLLLGESGTGKELLARYIHARSGQSGPFVSVDCSGPALQLDAELLGADGHPGRLEQARGGTLMLDLVSQMPLAVQARLLRVLQERSLQGAPPVCRIVATTQKDLGALVRAGTFRADLFYRLNVFPIALPALRERPEDLPGLAAQLVSEAAAELCVPPPRLTEAAIMTLQSERFPGNVRELKNLLGRALVRCRGPFLDAIHFGLSTPAHVAAETLVGTAYPCGLPLDLTALERLAIEEALRRVGGNRTHAARLLGIGLRTLRNKLRLWRETGLADSVEAEGSEHAA